MELMRAALYDRYGPPEVLRVGRVPMPNPGIGEVLVRVHATSVNGGELYGRAGKVKPVTGYRGFPKRIGVDYAGEVAAVGAGVTWLRPGDRVWGLVPDFTAASEFVIAPSRRVARAPETVSLAEAAAVSVGVTALEALRERLRLVPGERLLVCGGTGGVGHTAVQLGRHYGAHVTALASARNLDFVRELGAHEVHDYATTSPSDLGGFDAVLNSVGTGFSAYRDLLSPTGRMATVSFDPDHPVSALATIAASAVHGRKRIRFFRADPGIEPLEELASLVDTGAIRPVVDQVYPLADIAEAHAALEAGGVRGKIVVAVTDEAQWE